MGYCQKRIQLKMVRLKNIIRYLGVCLIAGLALSSCHKKGDVVVPPAPTPPSTPYVYNWISIADSAVSSLNLFWYPSGQYYTGNNNTIGWVNYWPTAHALDVLVDLYLREPSAGTKEKMQELITGVRDMNGGTYIRDYYDDEEWMALACLRAYNATQDASYKNITMLLWNDIKTGWSSDLGGGIWWRKDRPSKNTPSNMPACILATRLFKEFRDPDDSTWAVKIYNWEKNVLYNPATGLVYDNISSSGSVNTSWEFTYNQGTFIGAAEELYSITHSSSYISDAVKAADYTLQSGQLTKNGLLKDEGGGDGGLFKGVFVRYFTQFIINGNLSSDKKTQYINFLTNNAQKLWSTGTNKSLILFGSAWDTPPGTTTDLTVQLSGIMLFDAMADLKKLNLVN